jgi:hypothetical protein
MLKPSQTNSAISDGWPKNFPVQPKVWFKRTILLRNTFLLTRIGVDCFASSKNTHNLASFDTLVQKFSYVMQYYFFLSTTQMKHDEKDARRMKMEALRVIMQIVFTGTFVNVFVSFPPSLVSNMQESELIYWFGPLV